MNWLCSTTAAACLLVALAQPSTAQVHTGEIFGRAMDQAGVALQGATVRLSGFALLRPLSTTTATSGAYRFPLLPVGSYTVLFEHAGFSSLVRRDVVIEAGCHMAIDARLEPSGGRDTTLVTEAGPPADTRSTAIASSIARPLLETMPSGRDVRSVVSLMPGVTTSSTGTGGRSLVEPPTVAARGVEVRSWSLDGVVVTDWRPTSSGGVPTPAPDLSAPYNIAALEEVLVQFGGVDASAQFGGPVISLVTRSGSARVHGGARFLFTDHHLQSDNLTPELKAVGASFGDPTAQMVEVGAEIGGPIRQNAAWFWASVSRVNQSDAVIGYYTPACTEPGGKPVADAAYRVECMNIDTVNVTDASAKIQSQWTKGNRSTFFWQWSERYRRSRFAGPLNPLETTNRQQNLGLARPARFEHQFVASPGFVLDVGGSYSNNGYVFDFQDAMLASEQPIHDRATGQDRRSGSRHETRSTTTDVSATTSCLLPGMAGGDHAIDAGIRFRDTPWEQIDQTGGGAVAGIDSATGRELPYRAWIYRDGWQRVGQRHWSFWVQDSWRRGRLTINAGLRVDRQDDTARPVRIPANPVLPDLLPSVSFPGADSGVVFSDFSPRLGITWDPVGSGRTIVRASAARYWGVGIDTASRLQPTGQTLLSYGWNDANGDLRVQGPELDLVTPIGSSSNYVAASPGTVRSYARVDPGLQNDLTDEVTVSLDRQIARRVTLGVSYVARKYHQFQETYRVNPDGSWIGSDTFAPVTWTPNPANCPPGARCPTVTYYARDTRLPSETILRNSGSYKWHHSIDVTARKRMANNWMLALAFTWNASRVFLPEPTRDFTDPTNVAQKDGAEYGAQNARWVAAALWTCRLPRQFSVSAVFRGREGYPFVQTVLTPDRGALSATHVMVGRYASERYPDVYQLDVSFDRAFRLRTLTIVPTITLFSVTNSSVVLARQPVQNSASANQATAIAVPRTIRLDLKVTW